MSEEQHREEESPTKRFFAGALKVDPGEGRGPVLVGAGFGLLAEKITEIARAHDIPMLEDQELADSLKLLEVGAELPETLFPVVAEIIAHIYRVAERHREFPMGNNSKD